MVGASMFALISGVSAQVGNTSDFEAFQASWKKSHNVTTELTPAQYEQMKIEWMSSNATETARKAPVEMTTAEKLAIKKAEKNAAQGLPADFPMKRTTGDPIADEEAYQAAKALWIENNHERYQQMEKHTGPTKEELEIRRQELNNQIK